MYAYQLGTQEHSFDTVPFVRDGDCFKTQEEAVTVAKEILKLVKKSYNDNLVDVWVVECATDKVVFRGNTDN